MMMNLDSSSNLGMQHKPWQEDEKRINKFCFIGKNLDKKQMIEELKKCIYNGKIPDPGPRPTDKLTFKVGDIVQCKVDDWEPGIISELWHREDLWETGRYVPYQVILLSGEMVIIPRDSKVFIRPIDVESSTSTK